MWWPAIGAVFVGVGGIIEPRVLGVGYDTIHSLLRGEMIGGVVAGLLRWLPNWLYDRAFARAQHKPRQSAGH